MLKGWVYTHTKAMEGGIEGGSAFAIASSRQVTRVTSHGQGQDTGAYTLTVHIHIHTERYVCCRVPTPALDSWRGGLYMCGLSFT